LHNHHGYTALKTASPELSSSSTITMAVVNFILSGWSLLLGLSIIIASYLYSYFITLGHLRKIPSPFPAQFSNLWLLSVVRRGARYRIVDQVHAKLGAVVRIQPNHVSIADDEAIPIIYGHGNGFLKS
jgi:benzoate 4-monooxygenase